MESKSKSKPRKKYFLIGLGVTGILSLLGLGFWQLNKRRKEQNDFVLPEPNTANAFLPPVTSSGSSWSNNSFPLKKGSKGELVKKLQNALIGKYGAGIMPKYGADGYFGSELTNALISKSFPQVVDEALFKQITAQKSENFDAKSIANSLHKSAMNRNISAVLHELGKLNSTSDYTEVSNIFKTLRLQGVRQTLVNGLLSSFSNEADKHFIRKHFERIGLKRNGDKWSLSGLPSRKLITLYPATIWNNQNFSVDVPAQTIIGTEINSQNGITRFRTPDNKELFVSSNSVTYV